jgi:UDP-N-acetyl-2-amino-2-deoxyglucuronate dehydrogenase
MTIHIGLIGGGNITDTHARAARGIPGVEVAAIYGTNREKVDRLCLEYGGVPYADLEAFLAHGPMELVAIGSPSGLHAAHGIAAARRGLHVLVEKPIDITTERADRLIEETEKAGVKLGVFFQDRFKPGICGLKRLVDSGVLGRPILADARVKWYRPPEYYARSRWRGTLALDGGGALINQGVHTVDLLVWLLGDVAHVQARMATALHAIEAEDTLVALLGFANGALGVLETATSIYPGYPRRLELTGSQGTLILEQDRLVGAHLRTPHVDLAGMENEGPSESASSPVVADARGHQAVLEDFIRAIRNSSRPACDGREARRSLALVEAIYRACCTGDRVPVN